MTTSKNFKLLFQIYNKISNEWSSNKSYRQLPFHTWIIEKYGIEILSHQLYADGMTTYIYVNVLDEHKLTMLLLKTS